LTPEKEISLLDPNERILGRRCIDPLRPPDISGLGAGRIYQDVVPREGTFRLESGESLTNERIERI
jgi:hypothetical protein